MRAAAVAILLPTAVMALGCETGATQLLLTVEADEGIAAEIFTVQVRATGSVDGEHTFGVAEPLVWPLEITLATADEETPTHGFDVMVLPRGEDGSIVTSARVQGSFVEGETLALTLRLADCCAGRDLCHDLDLDRDRPVGAVSATCAPVRPATTPPGESPVLRSPWNGQQTGSAQDPDALRPLLRWEEVEGAERYEVELEDDCAVGGHVDCGFDSPVTLSAVGTRARPAEPLPVAASAPTGTRYAWRVRACNAAGCSRPSAARYLDVGRSSQDLDGDGFADVVVGAPHQSDGARADVGGVFVFTGAEGTLSVTPAAEAFPPDEQGGTSYGGALAVGDLDADGRAELLVGAPGANLGEEGALTGAGVVLAYELRDGTLLEVFRLTAPEPRVDARFGTSVAVVGDVDGNGYADVMVGAPGDEDPGRAYLFLSSGAGLTDTPIAISGRASGGPTVGYGAQLAGVGDVNGDGLPDVIVSAPATSGDATLGGSAFLHTGDATMGLSPEAFRVYHNADGRGGDMFGAAVGAGDLDGDGFADLAIGAHTVHSERGFVFVYYGDREGPSTFPDLTIANPQGRNGGQFGASLTAAGDLDGDGFDDLLVGARANADRDVLEAGLAYAFFGSQDRRDTMAIDFFGPAAPQSAAHFGLALSFVGDVNGDGWGDVLVAAPEWDADTPDEGRVFLFSGGGLAALYPEPPDGPDVEPPTEIPNPSSTSGAMFGVLP